MNEKSEIVKFPGTPSNDEESNRRIMVEAKRLADLAPVLSPHKLAALLRKLHIHPSGIAVGSQRIKGYYARDFFDKQIFERILGRDPLLRSRDENIKIVSSSDKRPSGGASPVRRRKRQKRRT